MTTLYRDLSKEPFQGDSLFNRDAQHHQSYSPLDSLVRQTSLKAARSKSSKLRETGQAGYLPADERSRMPFSLISPDRNGYPTQRDEAKANPSSPSHISPRRRTPPTSPLLHTEFQVGHSREPTESSNYRIGSSSTSPRSYGLSLRPDPFDESAELSNSERWDSGSDLDSPVDGHILALLNDGQRENPQKKAISWVVGNDFVNVIPPSGGDSKNVPSYRNPASDPGFPNSFVALQSPGSSEVHYGNEAAEASDVVGGLERPARETWASTTSATGSDLFSFRNYESQATAAPNIIVTSPQTIVSSSVYQEPSGSQSSPSTTGRSPSGYGAGGRYNFSRPIRLAEIPDPPPTAPLSRHTDKRESADSVDSFYGYGQRFPTPPPVQGGSGGRRSSPLSQSLPVLTGASPLSLVKTSNDHDSTSLPRSLSSHPSPLSATSKATVTPSPVRSAGPLIFRNKPSSLANSDSASPTPLTRPSPKPYPALAAINSASLANSSSTFPSKGSPTQTAGRLTSSSNVNETSHPRPRSPKSSSPLESTPKMAPDYEHDDVSVYSDYSFYGIPESPNTNTPRQSPQPSREPPLSESVLRSATSQPNLLQNSNSKVSGLLRPASSQRKTPRSGLLSDTSSPSSRKFRGHPQASSPEEYLQLGIAHHEVDELPLSAYCFERSAKINGGCGMGMLMWGLTLRHGWGVMKDEKRGFVWIRKAAEVAVRDLETAVDGASAGVPQSELVLAIYEVGQCFSNGWGVGQDKKMAVSYFQVAARLGDSDAQQELGFCYANGKGCKKDKKQAAKWYRAAADQGASTVGLAWIFKDKYR